MKIKFRSGKCTLRTSAGTAVYVAENEVDLPEAQARALVVAGDAVFTGTDGEAQSRQLRDASGLFNKSGHRVGFTPSPPAITKPAKPAPSKRQEFIKKYGFAPTTF